MGFLKMFAALPMHIKIIVVTVIALIGAWMVITPIYLEILSTFDMVPVWGWMMIGVILIVIAAKFGKAIV